MSKIKFNSKKHKALCLVGLKNFVGKGYECFILLHAQCKSVV